MDSFEVNLERHERSGSWRLLTSKGHEGVFWEPREGDAKTEAEATVMWPWAETNQGCQNPSKMVTVKEGRSVRLPRGNVTLSPQILEPDFKNYEGRKKKVLLFRATQFVGAPRSNHRKLIHSARPWILSLPCWPSWCYILWWSITANRGGSTVSVAQSQLSHDSCKYRHTCFYLGDAVITLI